MIIAAAAGGGYKYYQNKKAKAAAASVKTAEVQRGDIESTVSATGALTAVDSVDISSKITGRIVAVYVKENDAVTSGQLLVKLDDTSLKATEAQKQATMDDAKLTMDRDSALVSSGAISQQTYDTAYNNYRVAKAAYEQAVSNTNDTNIYSPIAGYVIGKPTPVGQTISSGISTPQVIMSVATLDRMQIYLKVDESDIGQIKLGQKVNFTVDAYPDDVFQGTVKQVRLEATTTNNVVTYEVVISAPNADLKLKPGLTANVTIFTQERAGILAVANKALRFTPTKETVGKNIKIVDCKGKNKVWTLANNILTAHSVTIGQSDGIHTEIIKGLKKGQKIVTEIIVNTPEENEEPQQSQGLISGPGPRGKKK